MLPQSGLLDGPSHCQPLIAAATSKSGVVTQGFAAAPSSNL